MRYEKLSKKLQEKARIDINEVPSQTEQNIEDIKHWLTQQYKTSKQFDDLQVLNFLRSCKFDLQRTKEKLLSYHAIKCGIPEFFGNRDPFLPEIQDLLKQGFLIAIESEETMFGLIRWQKCNPAKFDLNTFMKTTLMHLDIYTKKQTSYMVTGQQFILDLKGFSVTCISQFTPSVCIKLHNILKCYPLRIKGIYVVNCPPFFETVFNFLKLILTKKLRDRMYFYKEFGSVYQHIPKYLLPKEYGGENRSIDEIAAISKREIENNRKWFIKESQYFRNGRKY